MGEDALRLDAAVQSYYDRSPEESRLSTGTSQIEAARTKHFIGRFAPPPPALVLGIGGGANSLPRGALAQLD